MRGMGLVGRVLLAVGVFVVPSGGRCGAPGDALSVLVGAEAVARAAPDRGSGDAELFTYTGRVYEIEALGDSVWMGTSGGLVELDRRTREFRRLYTCTDGLPHPECADVVALENALWIATPGGLARLRPETGRIEVLDGRPVDRLFPQPARRVLWAVGLEAAVRVDLATGKTRGWSLPRSLDPQVFDDELWLQDPGIDAGVRLRRLRPLGGSTQDFAEDGPLPVSAFVSGLRCTGRAVWTSVAESQRAPLSHYTGGGVASIDRRTGRTRVYTTADGLPGNHVHTIQDHAGDLWAICAEKEWDSYRYSGGGLARFNSRAGQWEPHLSISGALHDEPTALKEIDGNLWVATRGYDETRWMPVSWGKGGRELRAPVVKHLALCRWRDDTQDWDVRRFPAEHNYVRITDFHLTADRVWLRIHRANVTEVRSYGDLSEEWLVSGPPAGGELEWQLRLDRAWHGGGSPASRAAMKVVDGALLAWQEPEVRYFGPQAEACGSVSWPSPLPVAWPEQVAVGGGEVWVGAKDGCLLRLDQDRRGFTVQGRLQTYRGFGAWTQVQSMVCEGSSALWVSSTAGVTTDPMEIRSVLPAADMPIWHSPNCVVRFAEGTLTVPNPAPWSWASRGESGAVSLVPPEEVASPRRAGISYNQFGQREAVHPGEPGVAGVLIDGPRLWLASKGDGLYLLDGHEWRRLGPLPPQELPKGDARYPECRPDDVVLALARVEDALYVATSGHLYRLRPQTGTWDAIGPEGFRPDYYPPRSEYGSSGTGCGRSFLVALDGDLWMPGGFPQSVQHERNPLAATMPFLRPTLTWLAPYRCALYRLRVGAERVERVPLPFAPSCAVAHEGGIYVGTVRGIVRIDPETGRQTWLTPCEGFPGLTSVNSMAADTDALWVASPAGVTRVTWLEFARRAVPKRPARADDP